MSKNRQLRRAQQRLLRETAGQNPAAATPLTPISEQPVNEQPTSEQPTSSPRQLANQRNAQASTGPSTETGKWRSSQNALRHGLTSVAVLLPGEHADSYTRLCDRFRRDWQPAGDRETELVQMLADTQWRLNRVPSLEAGIWASGRIEFEALFPEQPAGQRAHLIDNHIFKVYERPMRNLHLQESRLRRYYQATLKELETLQQERRAAVRRLAYQNAAKASSTAPPQPAPVPETQPNGFVFTKSTADFAPRPKDCKSSLPNRLQYDDCA